MTSGAHHRTVKKDSELSPELYRVARMKGTELAFSGQYWDEHAAGIYRCAVCGTALFASDAKFDSATGWPSFTDPVNLEHIELRDDTSHGLVRTEVACRACGAHLGHVFDDGPSDRGGKRYCINSVCLALDRDRDAAGRFGHSGGMADRAKATS